jgi:uncharacterized protein YidB (DUF937 family)
MGLFDSVIGALGQAQGGTAAGGAQGELLNAVLAMLGPNAPGGGLAALVQQFQQGGLGEIINSWISTGQNLPVSADQLSGVLGNERLGSLASQLGMPQQEVAGSLSQLLPQVIDKLTPNGQLPGGGPEDLTQLFGSLLRR